MGPRKREWLGSNRLACFDRSSIIRLCDDELGPFAGNGSPEVADAAALGISPANSLT
jgi:hypothetical protein